MCNALMKRQTMMREIFAGMRDRTANLPMLPAIFSD